MRYKKPGDWTLRFPAGCRGCGTSIRPHCRDGLCSRCNYRKTKGSPFLMHGDPEYGQKRGNLEEGKRKFEQKFGSPVAETICQEKKDGMYRCANPHCPDRKAWHKPNEMSDYKGRHFCCLSCINEYAALIGVKVPPVAEFSAERVNKTDVGDYTNDYLKHS